MISQRHLSRIASMQAIFSVLEREGLDPLAALKFTALELSHPLRSLDFAEALTKGVFSHIEEIKSKVLEYSKEGTEGKLDNLTFAILALGIYEIFFESEKQAEAIIINEAIELAKAYGKDSSPSFVNAILSGMLQK